MFSTVEFLDAIKDKYELRSDYALAKFMGWRQTRISQYRVGDRELDDDGCVQVAEKLGLPPAHVMACMASRRAENASLRRYWEEAAKLLKDGTWAVLLAAVLGAGAPRSSEAQGALQPLTGRSIHYAQWRRRRPWRPERRRRRRISRRVMASTANERDELSHSAVR